MCCGWDTYPTPHTTAPASRVRLPTPHGRLCGASSCSAVVVTKHDETYIILVGGRGPSFVLFAACNARSGCCTNCCMIATVLHAGHPPHNTLANLGQAGRKGDEMSNSDHVSYPRAGTAVGTPIYLWASSRSTLFSPRTFEFTVYFDAAAVSYFCPSFSLNTYGNIQMYGVVQPGSHSKDSSP